MVLIISFERGNLHNYDPQVAFWQFLAVGNYAARFYRFAMEDVWQAQKNLMDQAIAAVKDTELLVMSLLNTNDDVDRVSCERDIRTALTSMVYNHTSLVMTTWSALFEQVITKYHDGYVAEDLNEPTIHMRKLFYPKYWLDATGYWNSKSNSGPGVILFSSGEDVIITASQSNRRVFAAVIVTTSLVGILTVFVTKRYQQKLSLSYTSANSANDYLTV